MQAHRVPDIPAEQGGGCDDHQLQGGDLPAHSSQACPDQLCGAPAEQQNQHHLGGSHPAGRSHPPRRAAGKTSQSLNAQFHLLLEQQTVSQLLGSHPELTPEQALLCGNNL